MLKKCEWCGKEFEATHGGTKYCSNMCVKQARNQSCIEYQKRKKAEKPPKILKCLICGKEFESRRGATLCSAECREENQRRAVRNYYEKHYQPTMRKCEVCGKEFKVRNNLKVCSNECRAIRDKKKTKDYWERYKDTVYKRRAEQNARLKAEEPPVDYRHQKLDGKVLDKAQMTVDEYNRIHGTNYSYGQYVHYVERMQNESTLQQS